MSRRRRSPNNENFVVHLLRSNPCGILFDSLLPPPTISSQTVNDYGLEPATCRLYKRPSAPRCPQFVGIPLPDRPIIDFVRGITLNYWNRREASIIAEISSLIHAAASLNSSNHSIHISKAERKSLIRAMLIQSLWGL